MKGRIAKTWVIEQHNQEEFCNKYFKVLVFFLKYWNKLLRGPSVMLLWRKSHFTLGTELCQLHVAPSTWKMKNIQKFHFCEDHYKKKIGKWQYKFETDDDTQKEMEKLFHFKVLCHDSISIFICLSSRCKWQHEVEYFFLYTALNTLNWYMGEAVIFYRLFLPILSCLLRGDCINDIYFGTIHNKTYFHQIKLIYKCSPNEYEIHERNK